MNKILKYFGSIILLILVVFLLLIAINNTGIGCLYDCEDNRTPTYGQVNNYVNGKLVSSN
tara:strand:- start:124 stop:303 length:180 start_codon:yes stop_codon:yes gene_type:complete